MIYDTVFVKLKDYDYKLNQKLLDFTVFNRVCMKKWIKNTFVIFDTIETNFIVLVNQKGDKMYSIHQIVRFIFFFTI